MTWFRVGGAGIPASLKNAMNAVFNKKFGTSGQNYPPNQWPDEVNLMGPLPEGTASGSIIQISDGADQVPIKLWNSNVDANVSGVSSVKCTIAEKNLFDGFTKGYGINSTTGAIVTTSAGAISGYIPIKEAVNYYLSGITDTLRSFVAFYKSDKTFISRTNGNDKTVLSFTPPSESAFVIVYQYQVASSTGTIDDIDNLQTQLEVGSSMTSYVPYVEPTEREIHLGRTIYGGSLEFVNGTGIDENGVNFTFDPLTPVPETESLRNFWTNVGSSSIVYRLDINLALQAVSSSRGLMMASRPVTQLVGEESDPDQVNELVENDENDIREQLNEVVENDETEQEGENDAR